MEQTHVTREHFDQVLADYKANVKPKNKDKYISSLIKSLYEPLAVSYQEGYSMQQLCEVFNSATGLSVTTDKITRAMASERKRREGGKGEDCTCKENCAEHCACKNQEIEAKADIEVEAGHEEA